MTKHTPENYDEFYRRGGWQYDPMSEYLFLVYRILQPLRIPQGGSLLEIGCGIGLHAALFHKFDFRVTAVDVSSVAIAKAQADYPGPMYCCRDAHGFLEQSQEASFNLVFVRGLSWFHYELGPGKNRFGVDVRYEVEAIKRVLIPGGLFILQMKTDFSGTDCRETLVRNHTWHELLGFLEPLGELVLVTDWNGLPLTNDKVARNSRGNFLCALRKD